MLERKTIVDQIEIKRDGTMQVRMMKAVVDSDDPGNPIPLGYYRTLIEPGIDSEAQIVDTDAALANMKAGACASEEWDRVRRVVAVEHTPERVASFKAKRKSME